MKLYYDKRLKDPTGSSTLPITQKLLKALF